MKNIFFCSILLIIASSCKNDIKLNANYKEIIVVYGLLDFRDSVHYLRIQRAFQNTGTSAKEISQKPDSLYFDSLIVTIKDNTTQKVYPLTKETTFVKDTGYFQNKVNILYKFPDLLDPNHRYHLNIKNVYTGNEAHSETAVVGNPAKVTSPLGDTFDLLAGKKIQATFFTGINARCYDVFYRFKYDEYDSASGVLLSHKYLDYYIMRSSQTNSVNGNEEKQQITESDDILLFIGNAIPVKNGVTRVATNFDACYAGAAEDLNVYLDVSKPSLGIVQKKPEYTNIENGYGIFSSRNVFFKIHGVSGSTQATLRKNAATKNLGWK